MSANFTEKLTAFLGLFQQEGECNYWEYHHYNNNTLRDWVVGAMSAGHKLISGNWDGTTLSGINVFFNKPDGTTVEVSFDDVSPTVSTEIDDVTFYDEGNSFVVSIPKRQIWYADLATGTIKSADLLGYQNFTPPFNSLPLFHTGTYHDTAATTAEFIKFIANIKPFGQSEPIGTVKMFDGNNWVDNATMPGWYACIAGNEAHGCPNLVDKFVMGGTSAGATGGTNSYALSVAQLPSHNHNIDHDHTSESFTSSGRSTSHTHGESRGNNGSPVGNQHGLYGHYYDPTTAYTYITNETTDHTHSTIVDLGSYSGSSGATGDGSEIDNTPSYYQLIFIKRVA